MEVRLVYMTAGTLEEAKTIGNLLIQAGLAACVNILSPMHSLYVWEGDLQEDTEVVVIAKTTAEQVPELIREVKNVHSYDCPCILTLPVDGGNPEFLQWIATEVHT
ncbi:Periplasmic divalent cation tolerance protein CutA [Olavius algarvensis associated proteobacterium Delta 3]|nr:Periplasmic divalent cation tolerance protein CutA [Olavius algarvensis associated proteobacterium Delta 3]